MSLKEYIDKMNEAEGIEIFFTDLDETKQKEIMETLREALNVAEDDDYGLKQINEILSKKPLFIVLGNELAKELNIDL